ncbi:MAG: sulfatase-like hydrolase/transferase [Clostridia bacterium]|nr:sulfatase-like hydrolase/transferase [Clostridia bacterium]
MSVESTKKSFKSKILKRILPTYLISATIPFIVCICVPFEIFGKNQSEFLFSFSQFIPVGILFAFLFTLVFFFALLFLPNRIYKVASAVVIALAFMFFLQGTFLNAGITTLAGDNLGEEGIPLSKSVFNLVIWIVVITLAIVIAFLKDKNGIINLAGVLLCGIVFITSLMGPVSLALTTEGVFADKSERISLTEGSATPKVLTYKGLNEISSDKNVIIFCVDRFDQDYAEQAYTESSDIFDELDGFTAFDDNISLYTHTFPGVANLLTRNKYNPTQSRAEYLNSAYTDNQTLHVLNENGYKVNLYTASYYAYTDASFLPSYVSNVAEATEYKVEQKGLLSLSMMQIALYRCFPLMFKHYLGNINSATCNDYVVCEGSDGFSQYTTDMKKAFDTINSNGLTKTTSDKMFSFIHIDGCHDNVYDENCNKVKRGGSTMNSLKSSFKIINKYLDEMKKLGVYENSTIVITGDHASPEGNANKVGRPSLTALFFKRAGVSSGKIENNRNNTAQVTHEDIWPTIFDSEGISHTFGTNLFNTNNNRTREYFWHNYASPMVEMTYSINGAGKVLDNWELISNKTYNKFIMD